MAEKYLKAMGYGNNPYLIYFHNDTENNHRGIMNEKSIDNSSAYISGCLKPLKNDKKFIVEAVDKAQKAIDYILNQGS